MASPQKENGYTPIANEILEAVMRQRLGGTQLRLVLAVWRYTYGFGRRQHRLSEGFLARAVDAHPKQVSRELRALVKKRMLRFAGRDAASGAHILAFNKNYDEWEGADRLEQQERFVLYGSTFFNGRYRDYLEDEEAGAEEDWQ